MPDREKIIRGLKCCSKYPNEYGDCMGGNCPYGPRIECHKELIQDALALLKAQKPVEPNLLVMNGRLSNGTKYICGGCGGSFFHQKVNFCPWCGKAVKWE